MKPFVNLHTHSFYSVLEAMPSPKQILEKARVLGCPAVALTDKGALYGLLEFYLDALKVEGVKPILGVEVALSLDSRFEKRPGIDGKEGSVVLIAQNYAGYKNLLKIISASHLQGFFHQPRADLDLLREHCGGLFLLTGDSEGLLGRLLRDHGEVKALNTLHQLQNIFGSDQVILEFCAREGFDQKALNLWLLRLIEKHNWRGVMTSAARYLENEDEEATDVLYCIGKNELFRDVGRTPFVRGASFKSFEAMASALSYIPEEFLEKFREESLKINEKIDLEIPLGQKLLPKFQVPQGFTENTYLRHQCETQVPLRYGEGSEAFPISLIQERLNYELGVIEKMGFEAYFLIVADFIAFAKSQGISVGPGRGSAAGSIVSYLLGITSIDPLQYELLFERFLNPERVSMPDIDIDFSDERRDEVLQYVIEKYGEIKVSKVCTFGTLAAKAALKDVGRAMGLPFSEMNAMTKLIPARPGFTLREAEKVKDFMDFIQKEASFGRVFEVAKKLEGCVRHVSVHACAVIIGKDPLEENAPLQWAPGTEDTKITQFPYQQLETLGLLKMDFLGLKNLSVLEKTLDNIEQTTQKRLNLQELPIRDAKTFEMMARGETTGVFQFESAGMRRYLKDLCPTEFENLVAMNALYRPGPMEYIPTYIKGKKDPKVVKYPHPVLEPILQKTYGVAVYQEQVLRIAQDFAGFTLGAADILRKAIGKKIPEILAQQRQKFIEGAMAKGHKEASAIKIFDEIVVPFSGYGFNRSHAVCYARIAYETAYMRANYPAEFMAAMMTTDRGDTDRIVLEMNECQAMNIEVLPPSVNESKSYFTVVGPSRLRFGLTAIKGLGEETVNLIIAEREKNGWYASLQDFARRLPTKLMNKKTLEALAYSGAFDAFADRGAVVASLEELARFAREYEEKEERGQIGLFALEESPSLDFVLREKKASQEEILTWERESMGLFVSDHPLRGLGGYFSKYGSPIGEVKQDLERKEETEEIPEEKTSKAKAKKSEDKKEKVVIHGLVTSLRKVTTKTGSFMLIFHLEDTTGKVECVIFPKVYERVNIGSIKIDSFLRVEGRLEERNGLLGFVVDSFKAGNLKEVQRLWKEGKSFEEAASEVWVLEIPDHVNRPKIDLIKQWLCENRSEKAEASEIEVHVQGKKVILPFRVLLNQALKEKIILATKEEGSLDF